jgi:hypothetical protein
VAVKKKKKNQTNAHLVHQPVIDAWVPCGKSACLMDISGLAIVCLRIWDHFKKHLGKSKNLVGIILAGAILCGGCAAYDLKQGTVKSFGVDPQIQSVHWAQVASNANGTITATGVDIQGFERTGGVEGEHMIRDIACAAIGAVAGTIMAPGPGTAVGAAKGAVIGGAAAEIWQTVRGWWPSTAAVPSVATNAPILAVGTVRQ